MSTIKLNILAFGAHPDDVELGAGGVLAKQKDLGSKIGIIDLTEGELGTRGSVQQRYLESKNASEILGVSVRENLKLADGFFENNRENQLKVIRKIRQYKPDVVICNAPFDRHPDHGRAANLVTDAVFLSGLVKIETELNGQKQEAWRPRLVLQYIQFLPLEPTVLIDISNYMEKKLMAVKAYSSQFYNPNSTEPETVISKKGFLDSVVYRAQDLGRIINTDYAEGFIVRRYIGVNSVNDII
jgi:bacillithiol biosynthesis deacetylase BshB1